MLKPAVERHLVRAGELGEFCQAIVVAGADYFRDACHHRRVQIAQ